MPRKPRNRVVLPADLRVSGIAEVKHALLEALDSSRADAPLRVDAARIRQIDLSGIQLLLGLRRECAERERELVFEGVSRTVLDAARTAHVLTALGLGAES